jgi:tight adherence protein C
MDGIVTLENIVAVLVAVGSFITIMGFGMGLMHRDQLASRMKAVAARREELSRQQKEKFQQRVRLQPRAHVGVMRSFLEKVKLENLIGSKETKNRMAQAGWRSSSAPITFAFARVAAPVVLMILTVLFTSLSKKVDLSFPALMMVLGIVAVIGFYIPNVIVSNAVQKRQQVLQRSFPDALDLLVICVEAGLSVEAAFARVADEIADASPALAEELGLTTAELAFLGDRRQAFENLSDRTGLTGTKSLATALIQSEKYGTPVALALRVLSQENRDARMALAEKKAGALPAQLTVPMILFFLPSLFVVIIGPAIIQAIAQFKGG